MINNKLIEIKCTETVNKALTCHCLHKINNDHL